jgi:hypothetical protein
MCDDTCPNCGARDFSPVESDDLTKIVVPRGKMFAVLQSPDEAEHDPAYREVARFDTKEEATAFLAAATN